MTLVGIGGTGKTSLVRALTAHPSADPRCRTDDYKTYSLVHEVASDSRQKVCRIDVDDYRGQNLGQLISAEKNTGLKTPKPISSCVIFVVDLFPAPSSPIDKLQPGEQYSTKRIRKNHEEWSSQAIAAALSSCDGPIPFVCLYINKIDLLQPRTSDAEDVAKEKYKDLIDKIAMQIGGSRLEVVVGSADTGEKVPKLLEELIANSEKI